MQKDKKKRLAVVGAGLCGVAFVVHLARQLRERTDLALEVMVMNRKLGFARASPTGHIRHFIC